MRRLWLFLAVFALVANLLVAVTGGAAGAGTTAYLDPLLRGALTTASPTSPLIAIAELPSVPSATDLALIRATGVTAVGYSRLPMVAVQGTPAQITAVAGLSLVQSMWLNHGLELALHESTVQIGATTVRTDYGFTGHGVGVAVLDSGIDGTHPDLHFPEHTVQNVKILGDQHVFQDLTFAQENVPDTDTTTGHGSHVAGIVAGGGQASAGYYTGVAPGANLIGVGAADGLDMLTALAGYDWILANRAAYNIRVVNNSWADDTIAYDPNDPLNQASLRAYQAGITVVFAAGNDGQSSGNVFNRYAWPSWVVSVGGVDKNSALASYSSRGDTDHHPDLMAPGSFIASARALTGVVTDANSTPLDLTDPGNPRMVSPENDAYYTVALGTSMAAPHVAGVAALVLEANPSLTPDQVHSILASSATPVPGCDVIDCGAGVVNAVGAVRAALAARNQPPVARLSASPTSGAAPLTVTLDAGASSDADGTIVRYDWDLEGDGAVDTSTTTAVLTHTYAAGVFHPHVIAVDDKGQRSLPAAADVRASDPPVAVATAPTKAKAGATVTFDASGSHDPDGHIVGYTFQFGDGTSVTTTTPTASHVYAASRATLDAWRVVVTDDAGLTDAVSGTIKITP